MSFEWLTEDDIKAVSELEPYPRHGGPFTLVTDWVDQDCDAMLVPCPSRDNTEEWLKYTGELATRKDYR